MASQSEPTSEPISAICDQPDWGQTALKTPIPCTSSYPLDQGPSNAILFLGGVHGDEPEGVELAQRTLDFLRHTPARHPWILIPCINPDGYARQQRTNGQGVDLNRNFPASSWSSACHDARYSPGPQPASECETQSLVQLIEAQKPRLIIHCHSWQPCIVWTGAAGREPATEIARRCGYQAVETIGYDTPGSLGDYGGVDLQIPVICIEEQEHGELQSIWPRFESAIQWLFQTWDPRP